MVNGSMSTSAEPEDAQQGQHGPANGREDSLPEAHAFPSAQDTSTSAPVYPAPRRCVRVRSSHSQQAAGRSDKQRNSRTNRKRGAHDTFVGLSNSLDIGGYHSSGSDGPAASQSPLPTVPHADKSMPPPVLPQLPAYAQDLQYSPVGQQPQIVWPSPAQATPSELTATPPMVIDNLQATDAATASGSHSPAITSMAAHPLTLIAYAAAARAVTGNAEPPLGSVGAVSPELSASAAVREAMAVLGQVSEERLSEVMACWENATKELGLELALQPAEPINSHAVEECISLAAALSVQPSSRGYLPYDLPAMAPSYAAVTQTLPPPNLFAHASLPMGTSAPQLPGPLVPAPLPISSPPSLLPLSMEQQYEPTQATSAAMKPSPVAMSPGACMPTATQTAAGVGLLPQQSPHSQLLASLAFSKSVSQSFLSSLGHLSFQCCSPLHVAAYCGHQGIVDSFLSSMQSMLTAQNLHNCTPLHFAAHQGHATIVQRLAKTAGCHVDAVDIFNRPALHYAAARGHAEAVEMLWAVGASIDYQDLAGMTALHYAAEAGHLEVVSKLVIAGSHVQITNKAGMTAAHLAARKGHAVVLERLLAAGYLADSQGGNQTVAMGIGSTALHLAASNAHFDAVEVLLASGACPTILDGRGNSPLHYAAAAGSAAIFDSLLRAGADPLTGTPDGDTTLHFAAAGGNVDIIEQLLVMGLDVNARNMCGRTPIFDAAHAGHDKVVKMLLNETADLSAKDIDGSTVWLAAAQGPSVTVVQLLKDQGCDVHYANELGWTALHYAALTGHVGVLELLLQLGVDPTRTCSLGRTPLHYAASAGVKGAVELLLQKLPADVVNKQDAGGWTALHFVAKQGSVEVLQTLLEAGAECNVQSCEGYSALHLAAQVQGVDAVEHLLGKGADRSLTDLNGCMALHFAAQQARIDLFNLLYDPAMVDLDAVDRHGYTLIHYAVDGGSPAILQTLLSASQCQPPACTADTSTPTQLSPSLPEASRSDEGSQHDKDAPAPLSSSAPALANSDAPQPCTSSHDGSDTALQRPSHGVPITFSPLHLAAQKGHVVVLPQLLARGYAIDARGPDNGTALHYAAKGLANAANGNDQGLVNQYLQCMLLLLQGGCPSDLLDAHGCGPIHYTAGSGQCQMLEALLQAGADPLRPDAAGWTPLTWAACKGYSAVVTRLMQLGVSVMSLDRSGRLPLHWAAESGHMDTVTVLVEKVRETLVNSPPQPATAAEGASPALGAPAPASPAADAALLAVPDLEGRTPALLAAARGYSDIVALLLDTTKERSTKRWTALHLAAMQGNAQLVQHLLNVSRNDIHAPDADGMLPLHWAAAAGSIDVARFLLAMGAEVNACANDGSIPLHKAAAAGHTHLVSLLLDAKAMGNLKTVAGFTAMHLAAQGGHLEVVRTLIRSGCGLNLKASNGMMALYAAANEGHLDVVELLLAAGSTPEVNSITSNGTSALHAAATGGHVGVVLRLIDARADVDIQAQSGCTALHNACSGGYAAVVQALLDANCDTDIQNSNGNTALHVAASKGFLDIVEKLLAANCDIHIKNFKTYQAVHSAASSGYFDVVLRLVQAGAGWRQRGEADVVKLICKKTNYKTTYVEGRLRLAEKERARLKARTVVQPPPVQLALPAPGAPAAVVGVAAEPAGSTELAVKDIKMLAAAADANMRALLQEEEARREEEAKKRNKRKEKKKKKVRKGISDDGGQDGGRQQDPDVTPPSLQQQDSRTQPSDLPSRTGSHQSLSSAMSSREGSASPIAPCSVAKEVAERSQCAAPSATLEVSVVAQHTQQTTRSQSRKASGSRASSTTNSNSNEPLDGAQAGQQVPSNNAQTKAKPNKRNGDKAVSGALLTSDRQHERLAAAAANGLVCTTGGSGGEVTGAGRQNTAGSQRGAAAAVGARTPTGKSKGGSAASSRNGTPANGLNANKAAQGGDVARLATAFKQQLVVASKAGGDAQPEQSAPAAARTNTRSAASTRTTPSRNTAGTPQASPKHKSTAVAAAQGAARSGGAAASHSVKGWKVATQQSPGQGSGTGPRPANEPQQAAAVQHSKAEKEKGSMEAQLPDGHWPPLPSAALQPKETQRNGNGVLKPSNAAQGQPMQQPQEQVAPAHNNQQQQQQAAAHARPPVHKGSRAIPGPQPPPGPPPKQKQHAQPMYTFGSAASPPSPPLLVGMQHFSQVMPTASAALWDNAPQQGMALPNVQLSAAFAAKASQLTQQDGQSADTGTTSSIGPSMSMRSLEAIFTPFYSTSSSTNIWSTTNGDGLLGSSKGMGQSVSAGVRGGSGFGSGSSTASVLGGSTMFTTPASTLNTDPPRQLPDSVKDTARLYGMYCPITQELIQDPVVAPDGITYDRTAIQAWLDAHDVSPVTNAPLPHKELVPNLTMRSAMRLLLN